MLTLVGCGGVERAKTSRAPASSPGTGSSAVTVRRPTAAEAATFAEAVNLRAGDIPEARGYVTRGSRGRHEIEREFAACEGGLARRLLWIASPLFSRGRELEAEAFMSQVAVGHGPGSAPAEIAVMSRADVRICVAHALTRSLRSSALGAARWGAVTLTRLTDAPAGGGTLGLRLQITLEIPFSEVSVPFYVDYFSFASGPALVWALAASATQPVPAATERELVTLLRSRAQEHPFGAHTPPPVLIPSQGVVAS
jgi:hypothetical protein